MGREEECVTPTKSGMHHSVAYMQLTCALLKSIAGAPSGRSAQYWGKRSLALAVDCHNCDGGESWMWAPI